MSRVSIYAISMKPMRCVLSAPCVYRENGVCDSPRTNKGNSDAACFKMSNRDLRDTWLKPLNSPSGDHS